MNHPFTVIWIGAKLPDRRPIMRPGEEALCICAVCERSWVEHGEPDESHWEWRKLELAEAVAEAPWGIFDPSWFYELHKLSVSEIAVFLAFVAYRNGNSGESAPSLATVFALTGVSRRSIYRCIAKLVAIGLLTLARKRSGRKGDSNVYRLPPTLRHDEIMAKLKERKAPFEPQRPTRRSNDVSVPRPFQDSITPDLPEAKRRENMKRLHDMVGAVNSR